MKPSDSKPKSFFFYAIASYMLTQAVLLVLGAAASFTAFPSLMHYHAFGSSNVLMSWNFSDDGTLPHMLMLWGGGTVLFAVIFWLFLHFGNAEEELEEDMAVRAEPCADAPLAEGAENADAVADRPAGPGVGTVPHVENPDTIPPALARYRKPGAVRMSPAAEDGTSLGIIALICGLIAFIPGLGLVFAIAAIICGALGNMRASVVGNSTGRTLSIIGIALAAISLLLMVSTVVFLGSLFSALFGTMV